MEKGESINTRGKRNGREVFSLAAGILAVLLCSLTVLRNASWRDETSLLEDMVRKSPEKPRTYYNLGCEYNQQRRYADAIHEFTRSIELYRRGDNGPAQGVRRLEFYANAYFNRGVAFREEGLLDRAIDDFSAALSIDPFFAGAYAARGQAFEETGDRANAVKDLEIAASLARVDGSGGGKQSETMKPPVPESER